MVDNTGRVLFGSFTAGSTSSSGTENTGYLETETYVDAYQNIEDTITVSEFGSYRDSPSGERLTSGFYITSYDREHHGEAIIDFEDGSQWDETILHHTETINRTTIGN